MTEQRMNIRFYDVDVRERVSIISGEWPETEQIATDRFAVVIGAPLAESYGLEVGNQIPVSKRQTAVSPDLYLEVAAIVEPNDSQAPLWFGEFSP